LISSFKKKEWLTMFGRMILMEHENTRQQGSKKHLKEKSRQMG
jgi:hypothetical protein